MEVLGAVASCTAVVTLALQSTKVIYQVTKSVSTGSDDINKLARSTGNLRDLLEAIQRLAERAAITKCVADGKLLQQLIPVIKQCADELAKILPKLDQLLKGTDNHVWKKAKKYARVYLDTKGVAEIWNTVNHYVDLLGTHLGNAGVDVGLYNAERLHSLHNELSEAFRDNKLHYARTEEILRDQRAQAQELSYDLQAELHQQSPEAAGAASAHIEGLTEIKTSICDVRSSLISHCDQAKSRSEELLKEMRQQFLNAGNVASSEIEGIAHLKAHVNELGAISLDHIHQSSLHSEKLLTEARSSATTQIQEVERSRKEVMQKLNGISDHLKVNPSMTREHSSILQDLVEMMSNIQLEIGAMRQHLPESTKSEDSQAENGRKTLHMTYDADIERSIARLCDLAGNTTPQKNSEEAQSVIEDMRKIIGLIMEQIGPATPSRNELLKKRKRLSDYHYSKIKMAVDLKEDLARV